MEKSNYCRLAVNITATNQLNYCAHARTRPRFLGFFFFLMHMCCKLLHRRRLSAIPPHHFTRKNQGTALEWFKFKKNIEQDSSFVNKIHISIIFIWSQWQTTFKTSHKGRFFPAIVRIRYIGEISLIFVLFSQFN